MAECIIIVNGGGGVGSDELTAQKAHVLNGYTYVGNDTNDESGTGTMVNNGAVSKTLNAGESYTIAAGYHNGSGKITAANPMWTGWKQIARLSAIPCGPDDDTYDFEFTLDNSFSAYNTLIFSVGYDVKTKNEAPSKVETRLFCCSSKNYDESKYTTGDAFPAEDCCEITDIGVEITLNCYPEDLNGEISIWYDGDLDSTSRYAWFEVYLVAALNL